MECRVERLGDEEGRLVLRSSKDLQRDGGAPVSEWARIGEREREGAL